MGAEIDAQGEVLDEPKIGETATWNLGWWGFGNAPGGAINISTVNKAARQLDREDGGGVRRTLEFPELSAIDNA